MTVFRVVLLNCNTIRLFGVLQVQKVSQVRMFQDIGFSFHLRTAFVWTGPRIIKAESQTRWEFRARHQSLWISALFYTYNRMTKI